jgi:hypothetical protein
VASLIQTLSHYPTVVPTTVLLFCLLWFTMSLLVSGLDGNPNTHGPRLRSGHSRHGGQGHHRHAGHRPRSKTAGRLGSMPFSLSATIVSFGAWALCLLASLALDAVHLHGAADIVAKTAVLVLGMAAGLGLLVAFAIPAEKVLVTSTAPGRADAVGSTCKIRTLRNGVGDAKIISGRAVGSIIPFEVAPGDTVAVGESALIVSYDPADERFVIGQLDELLR